MPTRTRKTRWTPDIEMLLKLRTLNAAFRLERLSYAPTDAERIDDWHDKQKEYIHTLARQAGYTPEAFEALAALEDGH